MQKLNCGEEGEEVKQYGRADAAGYDAQAADVAVCGCIGMLGIEIKREIPMDCKRQIVQSWAKPEEINERWMVGFMANDEFDNSDITAQITDMWVLYHREEKVGKPRSYALLDVSKEKSLRNFCPRFCDQ